MDIFAPPRIPLPPGQTRPRGGGPRPGGGRGLQAMSVPGLPPIPGPPKPPAPPAPPRPSQPTSLAAGGWGGLGTHGGIQGKMTRPVSGAMGAPWGAPRLPRTRLPSWIGFGAWPRATRPRPQAPASLYARAGMGWYGAGAPERAGTVAPPLPGSEISTGGTIPPPPPGYPGRPPVFKPRPPAMPKPLPVPPPQGGLSTASVPAPARPAFGRTFVRSGRGR